MLNGKSHTCIHTKSILEYALSVWLIMKNSSFLLLYFFHLFLSFSFLYFFSVLHSLNLFLCYILLFLHHFLHPHVSQVLGVFFLCSPSPLLEPSTLSCKAACLLFRYYLHINTARELAGQHLMRGWQYFMIFFFPHPYLLSDIFLSPLLQSPSEMLP